MNTNEKIVIGFYGNPNSGKSTLVNCLIERDIVAVSDKPQTTNKIQDIALTKENFSFVFRDSPGINFTREDNHIQELNAISINSMEDSVNQKNFIVVPVNKLFINEKLLEMPNLEGIIISKVDMVSRIKEVEAVGKIFNLYEPKKIFCLSAKYNRGVDNFFQYLEENFLPQEVNKNEQYLINYQISPLEIIEEKFREAIFNNLHKEIPYQVNYYIDDFNETEKSIHCKCIIETYTPQHKKIVRNETLLDKISKDIIKKIEKLFTKMIFLKVYHQKVK